MHLRQEGQKKASHFAYLGGLTGPGPEILVLLFLSVLSNPRAPVHHILLYILVPVTHIKTDLGINDLAAYSKNGNYLGTIV